MLVINQFHNFFSLFSKVSNRFQTGILALLLFGNVMGIHAQNLTIADNGETGTSGTNWTTTGTNPITISISGSATVASSVIIGYLDSGVNVNVVVAPGVSGSGHLVFTNDFIYTGSSARTLTLTAAQDILINGDITAANSALSLNFIAGNRILLDAGIFTNGGAVTFNDSAKMHFQQTSGTQNLNTQGGNLDFNDTNIFLLRHDGSVAIETAGGELRLGTGDIEQTDTSYQIRTLLDGFGGPHVNSEKTYEINVVAGREYSMRLYFWDSWDNPEEGTLGIRQTNGLDVQYFRARRTNGNTFTSTNASNGTQFRTGNLDNLGRNGSHQDQYVDLAFVALTSGQLLTSNDLNGTIDDESLELADVYETQPTNTFISGSRSLALSTTTGRILGSSKNITGLATLTMSTNNDDGFMDGIISGTTNFVLNGTGRVRLSGQNSYTGTTTVNTGTLRLVPEYTNRNFITGAFINNGAVTYEGGNVDRETLFLDGAISGSGTWNVSNNVATLQFDYNRLSLRGTNTTSGQITVGQFGNLWLEGANVNSTSNIALNDVTSRLRFFAPTNATIAVGALTGTGTVDFANGNGGTALTLSTNIGAANVQFDGFFTNSGTLGGPTSLSLTKQGTGTFTLTQNNTYSGSTTINAGTLVLQNNAPDPTNKTFNGTGGLRIESTGVAFTGAFSTAGWSFGTALSALTIGKLGNTADVTFGSSVTIGGSIAAYGGTLAINVALTATNSDITLGAAMSVTQTAPLTANGLALSGSGSVILENINNSINTIAGGSTSDRIGALSFINSKELTIGYVNPLGIYATGVVELATLFGDLLITEPVNSTLSTGDAIKLYANKEEPANSEGDGNIKISNNGSIAVEAGARVLLYSGRESLSTGVSTAVGGMSNIRTDISASTTVNTITPAIAETGSFALFRVSNNLTITDPALTLSKTYNGNINAVVEPGILSGITNGDIIDVSATATYEDKLVGTDKTITVIYNITGANAANYTAPANTVVNTGIITVKTVTLTGLTGVDKVYDGLTIATATGIAALDGLETGDDVTLSGTPVYTFAQASAGTGIGINTTGFALSGTEAGNYTLVQPTLSADITSIELTITGLTGDNKAFDGTTDATATGTAALSGVVSGDDVTLSGTPVYTFAQASAGTGIDINTTGFALSGTDVANYTLVQPVLSANIDATLGVDNMEPTQELGVYPNPATTSIYIKGLQQVSAYRIYNILGMQVKRGTVASGTAIEITNFQNGMYVCRFEDGRVLRFVKR
jgi:autotransporter-associated beta strand protein